MHDAENIAPNVQPSFTKNLVSTCACTRMHACPQRPRALRHISSFPRVQKAKKDTVVPDFKEHCESEERKQHEVHAHNVHARTTNPKMNLSNAKGWGDWPIWSPDCPNLPYQPSWPAAGPFAPSLLASVRSPARPHACPSICHCAFCRRIGVRTSFSPTRRKSELKPPTTQV